MLKQMIKENLETIVQNTIFHHSQDETLAYDISKQCVTDEDVEKCLETMLEHISEEELTIMFKLLRSDLYNKYTKAIGESMDVVHNRVEKTLYLLLAQKGEA